MELIINDKLRLETVKAQHSQELFALVEKNRSYLEKWFSWVKRTTSQQNMHDYLVQKEKEIDQGIGFDFCIKKDNQIIGKIGFNKWNKNHFVCDLAYWISQEYQGQGIITLCSAKLIQYAFENLNMNRIEIGVRTNNKASLRIPEKLGFTHEGILRDIEYNNGVFHSGHLYALLKKDWLPTQNL